MDKVNEEKNSKNPVALTVRAAGMTGGKRQPPCPGGGAAGGCGCVVAVRGCGWRFPAALFLDDEAVGLFAGGVRVDDEREADAVRAGGVADVFVQVGREVDVGPGFVEHGDEFAGDVEFAVPPAERGHVADDDLEGRLAVEFAAQRPAQPFGLPGAVVVVGRDAVVFDVAVGLVFAAVEHDEADRALAEHVEEFFAARVEIVFERRRQCAACFVVATAVVGRYGAGEELDGAVHEAAEHLFLVVEGRDHVAVEEDEVGRVHVALPDELFEQVVLSVDVIDHGERDGGLGAVVRAEGEGFAAIDVGGRHVAVGDAVALVRRHLLHADAVAVARAGFEARQPDGVDAARALDADVGVVGLGAFLGIEVRAVVGRRLHPTHRRVVGDPDEGGLVLAHVLQVGAVNDSDAGQQGARGSPDEQQEQAGSCLHRLLVLKG